MWLDVLEMSRNPPEGVSVGLGDDENIFNWEIMLVGPPDTLYEGGFFKCVLDFPPNFPNMPPKMTFKSEMWHPNGTLCSHKYMCLFRHIDLKEEVQKLIAAQFPLPVFVCSVRQRCGVHLDLASTW